MSGVDESDKDIETAIDTVNKDWGCVIVLVVLILAITAYQIAKLYVEAK